MAGDELGLVEAAGRPPWTPGRRPGHDVDAAAGTSESVDQQPGQVPGNGPAIAVLEAEQDVASSTGERHGDEHTGGRRRVEPGDEREPAGPADGRAGLVAAGTAGRQEHASIMMKGCYSGRRRHDDPAA